MITHLPRALTVGGVEQPIRTDYRVVLDIFEMLEDNELLPFVKMDSLIKMLYVNPIPNELQDEAMQQAQWYIDCGIDWQKREQKKRVVHWTQDAPLILPAVNNVVQSDVRDKHMHWWTFFGYYMEIRHESLYSTVLHIRHKLADGKRLSKEERQFYTRNKDIIDIKCAENLNESDDDYEFFKSVMEG